ncbi:MAG: MBL fold metallo-hydrolase [Deltaproteobacteria bacterium]|nr:MBL fold metallo-hydrolase [Deltaproteobacteria bacterium]MCL5277391.1 MBL fold metallo-hydrolase [Deltaproteobacteria bacterium]
MGIKIIDLGFFEPETIACFLIETGEGPILIETGPDTVYKNLTGSLERYGHSERDVRAVFVSHIHLDHAGSAWHLADAGATVFVNSNGARHLSDPSRLLASAKQIYKDDMDRLWGRSMPISADRIHPTVDREVVEIGGVRVQVFETQGHASHHNIYLIDGMLFTGDAGGIRIKDGPVFAPTPPPDINVEMWQGSIEKMRMLNPSALYLTHFGVYRDVREHLQRLEDTLLGWTDWVGTRLKQGKPEDVIVKEFEAYFRSMVEDANGSEELYRKYELADPAYMNALGLIRYWKKFRP